MPPSRNEQKYDRQLRLWAANGQKSLEEAHICVLSVTAVSTETLKNLVLPGIGRATVVDGGCITESDLASNFFLDESQYSQSRAKVVSNLLLELNHDLQISFIEEEPHVVVNTRPVEFWEQFSVVLVSSCDDMLLSSVSKTCYSLNIPLVVVDSMGFYGYLRISLNEHTVIESHPDSLVDLRLDRPWNELVDYIKKQHEELPLLDQSEHEHVPYVTLLLIYLEEWKRTHNDQLPGDLQERKQFKQLISSGMLIPNQENFEEALAAVWRLSSSSGVPGTTNAVLGHPNADVNNVKDNSSVFWILSAALKQFVDTDSNGMLPLSGVLPDMTATTKRYIDLQQLYRDKAKHDFIRFKKLYSDILSGIGKTPVESYIPDDVGLTFCKNARFIQLFNGSPTTIDYKSPIVYGTEESSLLNIMLSIRAIRNIQRADNVLVSPEDEEKFVKTAESLIPVHFETTAEHDDNSCGISEFGRNVIKELCRSQGEELVNISAVIGGMAAQEIVKLVSHQYIPLDNTVVYDGIAAKSQAYKV